LEGKHDEPSAQDVSFLLEPVVFMDSFESAMKTTIQVELPSELVSQARTMVEQGWAGGVDELVAEALRRYLDSHSARLTEHFVREDVEWGLKGDGGA
jgi:Arc/MetJ-type ribon-helix-helix transcriptional regulator